MSSFIIQLSRLSKRLQELALLISAFAMILMVAIICWQVFTRYGFNRSPAWSEPVALLLMLYYILLTAAVGVAQGFHLGLRFVLDHAKEPWKFGLTIVNYCFMAFFGLQMALQGAVLADFTSTHIIPTLSVSRSLAYWPFVGAGVLIMIFCLERILLTIADKTRG